MPYQHKESAKAFNSEAIVTAKAISLNYVSVDQFLRHYAYLIKGKLFLGSKNPLPQDTPIALRIRVPGIDETMQVEAKVLRRLDQAMATRLNKPAGMLIGLNRPPGEALRSMQQTLATNTHYRALLDLADQAGGHRRSAMPATQAPGPEQAGSRTHPDTAAGDGSPAPDSPGNDQSAHAAKTTRSESQAPALSMTWIREAIAQEEAVREEETLEDVGPAVTEKKELTPQERSRVKPVADFIMDLTKAMLRTGYYAADHPGAKNAKHGLFEAFRRSLGDASEIMLTNEETREKNDILISGILDAPVNVRTLVGAGMAELFVPKLREYFNRKGLVSFAIKKSISAEHFEGFVDIMGDQTVDRGEDAKIGAQLSGALVNRGITEISTVFMDDIIALEMNLPWRVEMAIQRLAKDLKVLPMFQTESDATIKKMKLQIIQDIIRPLKHPEFLKDLIINCYVIAQHVENIESEDIEKVIIEAFPLASLLPTSRLIFEELKHLRTLGPTDPGNQSLRRRFGVVKRILKWLARRLVLEDVGGAQGFLEQLYQNGLLRFEELPADVQYLINTSRMAADVQAHPRRYAGRLLQPSSPADAETILRCFRRVVPHLMQADDWRTLLSISQAAARFSPGGGSGDEGPDGAASPIEFVFDGQIEALVAKHEHADEKQSKAIEAVIGLIGSRGIEVLSKVLSQSQSRSARKAAMGALVSLGDQSREWVVRVLDDEAAEWFIKRNALILLGSIGIKADDLARVRRLLHHPHARVREEALHAIVSMRVPGAEGVVIEALEDADEKVRWRALSALPDFAPLSGESLAALMAVIEAEAPEDVEAAASHHRKVTQLIRAIGAMKACHDPGRVEQVVLVQARKISDHKRGFLRRLKKDQDPEQTARLQASLMTLANIGSAVSLPYLQKLGEGKDPSADAARKAADLIGQRLSV